ncbi:beta-1,3-glucan-binding protein-like [Euwallacea fornicatus]|uniref:beta-1,3-glucan-binding protein-like n=1 Tax=Euwallacea fornicatus TaxID=995702 RepID=UPI00338FCCAC
MINIRFRALLLVAAIYHTPAMIKGECDIPSVTTTSGTHHVTKTKLCPNDLIFEDDFKLFDLSKWQHEITLAGGGNGEFQYYLNNRSNSYVENRQLHIRPTFLSDDYGEEFLHSGILDLGTQCTNNHSYGCRRVGSTKHILNPIKSARIRTIESFSFKYGTVVVRAKLPSGDWLWPAIWLLPTDSVYGNHPVSGEIDLLEGRGNANFFTPDGINMGTQQVESTLHWGTNYATNQYYRTHFTKHNVTGYDRDFHVFKLVWNPDRLEFWVDDEEIGRVTPPGGGFYEFAKFAGSGWENPWVNGTKMAPFDEKFHIIINLAIGGVGYFPDGNVNPGGKPWNNTSPSAMAEFWEGREQWENSWKLGTNESHFVIDYIKIYAI